MILIPVRSGGEGKGQAAASVAPETGCPLPGLSPVMARHIYFDGQVAGVYAGGAGGVGNTRELLASTSDPFLAVGLSIRLLLPV